MKSKDSLGEGDTDSGLSFLPEQKLSGIRPSISLWKTMASSHHMGLMIVIAHPT